MDKRNFLTTIQILSEKFSFFLKGDKPFKVYYTRSGGLELILSEKGFERENCRILLEYLEREKGKLFSEELTDSEFEWIRELLDQCYFYRKKADKEGEFENQMLSLRLGGNIPFMWLKENPVFKKWIKKNHLHHRFFVLRFILPFNKELGAAIPIDCGEKTTWVFWREAWRERGKYFDVDREYQLLPGYTVLQRGISQYNTALDSKWIPFQQLDSKEWGGKCFLEVWTVSLPLVKPSMFRSTHAYVILKDDQGYVRSVGQDVLVPESNYKITEMLNYKNGFGKIVTPDVYVFYPKNVRRFWKSSFEITKEEHDRIIALVEKDKQSKGRVMSVLKGNCVSYVLKILREGMGIEIDASMHGLHILLKEFLSNGWYRVFFRYFNSWYRKQSPFIQKGLFFLPFIYIPHLLIGIAALVTSQNSYHKQRDFSLKDLIFRPWTLSCDHPLALHRRLEEIYDLIPFIKNNLKYL